ncbi:hypothetical protein CEW81_01950 [Kluyvera genomosp. 3]|uniref:DUF2531 family protein n=1 Tax=Kluyvera genomosp. 3 TaxID=2774055 RepID=A0A248KFH8_9ENTR|nr:hypothetical protein CEW81_01950 [Kluyvera genomosp. 3]
MTMNLNIPLGILLALPLLCGLRDPFAPVDDPCHSAQLNLWRFGGTIEAGDERWASSSAMMRHGNVWKTTPY